jgi:hypothetical protein
MEYLDKIASYFNSYPPEPSQSNNRNKPDETRIDRGSFCSYFKDLNPSVSEEYRINVLKLEVEKYGPLIGLGSIGPRSHTDEPHKTQEKYNNQDVYEWEKGTNTFNHTEYFFILEVKKVNTTASIYFALSEESKHNVDNFLSVHVPSITDNHIYRISSKDFETGIIDIFLPAISGTGVVNPPSIPPNPPRKAPQLSPQERYFTQQLSSLFKESENPPSEEVKKQCHQIGQNIFRYYLGNSESGPYMESDLQKIIDAVPFFLPEGDKYKELIKSYWEGVGDDRWRLKS